MKVLVTGANGFIGKRFCQKLHSLNVAVVGAVRTSSGKAPYPLVEVGDIGQDIAWRPLLEGVDVVVHLVSRVHVLQEKKNSGPQDILAEFRRVNVEGTKKLAQACIKAGVKKFIFMSSVKVNGEGREIAYSEKDEPRPEDAYGLSKWEAEQELSLLAASPTLEVVIIRPPLVYGPGVRANFFHLMKAVDQGLPLPLRGVGEKRSFIFVDNLVDAVWRICQEPHKDLAEKPRRPVVYLVSDHPDMSTAELVGHLSVALNRPNRSFYVPSFLLKNLLKMTGKSALYRKLTGPLQVKSELIKRDLKWTPPFSLREGLRETVKAYRESETL